MKPIVIIGSGLAGYMTAKEWRKHDKTTPLIILTEDNGDFYSKPMLSNSFRMGKSPEDLITCTAADMAEQLNATIKTHCHVCKIDSHEQLVITKQESIAYSKLVLACGAVPRKIPIQGEAAKEVLSVNNLEQYTQFRSHLNNAKHITILGTGLVGCEFANDLRHHGYEVTMLSPDQYLLQRFLTQPIAEHIQSALEDFGVTCHLETVINQCNYNNNHIQVTTSQPGLTWQTDAILSAAGILANTELAQTANIECQQAINVNEFLETSVADIYSLGDCAAYGGQQKMYVAPILHAARALGQTLAGQRTSVKLPRLPIKIKTSVCPLVFLLPSHTTNIHWKYEINSNHEGIALSYDNNEQLQGFILWGKATSQQAQWLKTLNTTTSPS